MYLLAVFSPFIGSLLAGLGGRFFGARGSALLTIYGLLQSLILSFFLWYEVSISGSPVYVQLGSWFKASTVDISWSFYFDSLTVCMMLTVTLVSTCVHIYSLGYMNADPHLPRFMSYLSLFTGFMLILVSGYNMIQMLVGWEGMNFQCLNGLIAFKPIFQRKSNQIYSYRSFYIARKPAAQRRGPHSYLFKQILVGFLLGDGWLEIHGKGVRLGILQSEKFADCILFYKVLLFGCGYLSNYELGKSLKKNKKTYFQFRTFTFENLYIFYNLWYVNKKKIIPLEFIKYYLTPFALAIWIMGDGSGMSNGGFKISTHCFSQKENKELASFLLKKYGLICSVLREGSRGYYYLYVWKRSMPKLYYLILPYLLPSCYYKFRFFKK